MHFILKRIAYPWIIMSHFKCIRSMIQMWYLAQNPQINPKPTKHPHKEYHPHNTQLTFVITLPTKINQGVSTSCSLTLNTHFISLRVVGRP